MTQFGKIPPDDFEKHVLRGVELYRKNFYAALVGTKESIREWHNMLGIQKREIMHIFMTKRHMRRAQAEQQATKVLEEIIDRLYKSVRN